MAVAAIIAAGYSWLSLLRFFKMQAGIDLALYTQAVQGYSEPPQWPISDLKGSADFDLLGDHFTPVVALAAPAYRVCPHAWVLMLCSCNHGRPGSASIRRVSRT